ncbi:hypothetical protein J6P92_06840 [bacterium]|nr:hypothetical protein [bacterium]
MTTVMGILLNNRTEEAVKFQEIITECGCNIRTRIGLHNIGEYKCVNSGIILLEVVNNINEIYDTLSKHWNVQIMRF